jgi:hypothetical protein
MILFSCCGACFPAYQQEAIDEGLWVGKSKLKRDDEWVRGTPIRRANPCRCLEIGYLPTRAGSASLVSAVNHFHLTEWHTCLSPRCQLLIMRESTV